MKIEQIKLDGTAVEFYNNNINEINFKCLENIISILVIKLLNY